MKKYHLEEEHRFLLVLRRWSTRVILNYVDEHENTQCEDLLQFSTPRSLNKILIELHNWEFIECFCNVVTGDNRVELTERGKKVLGTLRELIRILKDGSPDIETDPDEVFPYW